MDDACQLGSLSPAIEARGLLPLLKNGSTIAEIRELIRVPLNIEQRLREFAAASPEDGYWIEQNLKFRQAVEREFEKLVGEVPVRDSTQDVKKLEATAA